MAPTGLFVFATLILSPLVMDIVGWSDPLKDLIQGDGKKGENGGEETKGLVPENTPAVSL
jgi:hypothetical protein